MIIFTLRRLLLLLVTLFFLTFIGFSLSYFYAARAATRRIIMECLGFLVQRSAALGLWRVQH